MLGYQKRTTLIYVMIEDVTISIMYKGVDILLVTTGFIYHEGNISHKNFAVKHDQLRLIS